MSTHPRLSNVEAEKRSSMHFVIERAIEALGPPRDQNDALHQRAQSIATAIQGAFDVEVRRPVKVDVFLRADRSLYWFVSGGNGLTHRPHCIGSVWVPESRDNCIEVASVMVGPESLCADCGTKAEAARERDRARVAAFMDTPEARAEAAREQAWERRVS